MKVITIGDIHGKDVWDEIDPVLYDKIIFVGDYTDAEDDVSNVQILYNLEQIINLKLKYQDKVELLIGNHDFQYIRGKKGCSGFRIGMLNDLNSLFRRYIGLFEIAYQYDNYLWTHAGVTKGWYTTRLEKFILPTDINLAYSLNRIYWENNDIIKDCALIRGGKQKIGGPIWSDKSEIYKKPLKGYHQITGHNPVRKISTYAIYKDKDTSTTFTDCLRYTNDFHTINI